MKYTAEQARAASKIADYIVLPDNRRFRVMWRFHDQFGVRSDETGEQYAFTPEEAANLQLGFLVLCPIDMATM